MNLARSLAVLKKRWYVVVVGVTLTALAIVLVVRSTETVFIVQGSMLYVDPQGEDGEVVEDVVTSSGFISTMLNTSQFSAGLQSHVGSPVDITSTAIADTPLLEVVLSADDSATLVSAIEALPDLVSERVAQVTPGSDRVAVSTAFGDPGVDRTDGRRFSATIGLMVEPAAAGSVPAINYSARILEEKILAPERFPHLDPGIWGYEFSREPRDDAPITTIAVTGSNARAVSQHYRRLINEMEHELLLLAGEAAEPIQLQELRPPTPPLPLPSRLTRVVVALGALGLAASVGLAIILETLLSLRRPARNDPANHQRVAVRGSTPPRYEELRAGHRVG